jgi:hypothetical protein
MITSTNTDRIKDWLTANSAGVRQALDNVLPDAWLMQADRELTEQTNTSLQQLDAQDFRAALGRYQQLVSAYNELRSLTANIDLETLRNQNLYEIAVMEGDIKRVLATMRGAFKSELAALEGQNALELADVENDAKYLLAQEITPIERESRLRIADLKGENDLDIQGLDNQLKLELANTRGGFNISMANIDKGFIEGESSIAVSAINQTTDIDRVNLEALSANEVASITGRTSIDVAGIKSRVLIENQNLINDTNTEIRGIDRAALQDKFYIDNAATVREGFTDESAVVRTGSITREAGQSAWYETLINADDVTAMTNESAQQVLYSGMETGLKLSQIKNEGFIERNLNWRIAELEKDHAIDMANKEVTGIADALSERLYWAGEVVTTETGAIIDAAYLEAEAIVQQATDDMLNKQLTTQIELGSRKEVNRIELQAIADESIAEIGFANQRSTAKIGNMNSATDIEITSINGVTQAKNEAEINMTFAKQNALTNKATILIADIKAGTLVKTSEIDARATIMDTYTRGQADIAYTNAADDANDWSELAIQTADAEIDLAEDYSSWANANEDYVNGITTGLKQDIASYGKVRAHVKYAYRGEAPGAYIQWPERPDDTPNEKPFLPPEFSVKKDPD